MIIYQPRIVKIAFFRAKAAPAPFANDEAYSGNRIRHRALTRHSIDHGAPIVCGSEIVSGHKATKPNV